ncbi:MAG: hypothetical protein QOH57_3167 [Mycobacterium sp.]|nr:hypothetical protein [Mycobacterium sp.]
MTEPVLLGRCLASKAGLQLLTVVAATFVERGDAGGGASAQRTEDPHPERQRDHDREGRSDVDREIADAGNAKYAVYQRGEGRGEQ